MRRPFTLLPFIWLFASVAAAQEAPFPLSQALSIARAQNPEIKAARSDWEAVSARVLPEKTWKPPQIGVEYWGFHGADVGAVSERWYDLSQDVPFPGKLHLRGEAASHDARREEEVYHGVEQDVLMRVKDAYYRALYTTKAKRILDENVEVMRRFTRTTEAKYATGKASQSDALRAQVELSKTLSALLLLEQENTAAQARLNKLLDRSPDTALGALEEPSTAAISLTEQDLEQAALAERPEVLAASHHIDHMKATLNAERADYLPDFSLQYTRRERDGLPSDSIARITMSLPFLYFWRPRARTEEASAQLSHAESTLRSEQDAARSDVKEDWSKVQTIGRLVDLYRTSILPQAEQSVKVTEAAYQTDRVDFLNLLDSQRALLEFRLDYDQYVSQYGEAVAELERVLGVELDSVKPGMPPEHHHDHE